MDPDTVLADIRELAAKLTSDDQRAADLVDVALDLADRVTALDEWLSRGGSLPAAWRPEASTPAS